MTAIDTLGGSYPTALRMTACDPKPPRGLDAYLGSAIGSYRNTAALRRERPTGTRIASENLDTCRVWSRSLEPIGGGSQAIGKLNGKARPVAEGLTAVGIRRSSWNDRVPDG